MPLINRFGWSLSREAMFDECKRRYYFHYYLSWGGWNNDASEIARESFKLKRLVSLPLWRGQLVHYVVSKILQSTKRRGKLPDRRDVLRYTEEHFNRQFEFSRTKRYLTEPKKRNGKLNRDWLALFEHEYNIELPSEKVSATLAETTAAVDGFYHSPILEILRETETSKWIIEDIDIGSFSQSFEFEGALIHVKTDFIFRGSDGTFNIVDWKTHRRDGANDEKEQGGGASEIQLGVYAYYASKVLGEEPDNIRLYEVNLLDGGSIEQYRVEENSISVFESYIRNGIDKLSRVLEGHDIEANLPLPPENFPKIDNHNCRYCNFFRICKDTSSNIRLQ